MLFAIVSPFLGPFSLFCGEKTHCSRDNLAGGESRDAGAQSQWQAIHPA
jgi:hypothetical protein